MKSIRNSKGFTLIELMIVVVIIGILAAIAIPKFSNVSKNAKQAEAYPVLKQICTLQEAYFLKNDSYATKIPADPAKPGAGELTGWSDPAATYFTFSTNGTPDAIATPTVKGKDAKLPVITRTCSTGAEVESAAT